jgi:hypothetical protein
VEQNSGSVITSDWFTPWREPSISSEVSECARCDCLQSVGGHFKIARRYLTLGRVEDARRWVVRTNERAAAEGWDDYPLGNFVLWIAAALRDRDLALQIIDQWLDPLDNTWPELVSIYVRLADPPDRPRLLWDLAVIEADTNRTDPIDLLHLAECHRLLGSLQTANTLFQRAVTVAGNDDIDYVLDQAEDYALVHT